MTEIRVEAGAGDDAFAVEEVTEILEGLRDAQAQSDGKRGVIYRPTPSPMQRLATLLREAVQDIPPEVGCTGRYDDFARLAHDGETCPVHEDDD